ncbi:SDR family NAD(P)-dependent oxidoreductase [Mycolicibacterium aromaticivorans]|uniref:SDR family NAD(P)-dependent oxidoreductase n=1 Tax=Mycolicibacterium aromaticivorans TaxID=318425 RepID=UPI00068CEFFF|nr:SDR family oxidoreductase [Mycolicibacterium aromaticivorans]
MKTTDIGPSRDEDSHTDPHSVAGRTIVITGGSSGIGAEIAADLVSAGANAVIADLAEPQHAVPDAAYHRVDITKDTDLLTLVEDTVKRFGAIDALVNCAASYKALGSKKSLDELTTTEWDDVLRVNVRGTWQAIKAVFPVMKERGGHIVNISSTTARSGNPGFPHYIASKAAVEGLTRAAARELGTHGITVNAVALGLVDDEATNALNDRAYVEQAIGRRAIKRTLYPRDVAAVVRFLCSDASGFISGQVVIVDGGGIFT